MCIRDRKNSALAAALFLIGSVSAGSHLKFSSPKESFYNQSADLNGWTTTDTVGCIIGFTIFGLLYIYTVGYIFVDIRNRGTYYDDLIENDVAEMVKLGLDMNTPEFKQGLADKLSGVKEDDRGDDQLYGRAAELSETQWRAGL